MRIDVFMKKVLLFRTRNEAKKMCDNQLIIVNGKETKPSHRVREGDMITIETRHSISKYRILQIPRGNVRKDEATGYYEEIV